MSINAEYLRLGNWVETYMVLLSGAWYDKDGNPHGEDKITEPTIRQKQIDLEDLRIIQEAKGLATYRGIPLTTEILLAAGFECDTITYYNNTIMLSEGDHGFTCWYKHFGEGYRIIIPIKHLHQLQNLYFSLTATELIYNPK